MQRLEQYDTYPLPLDRIWYDADFNCRGQFTLESVMDLAANIRLRGGGVELKGLDFPVVVQPLADVGGEKPAGFDYRLLAGHRRFKAVQTFLKWPCIPSMIRPGLSDREARMLNFVENLERKDLNVLQEARALGRLFPEGISLRAAAAEIKRPTRWVHARLRLLTLPEEVQELAASGLLAMCNVEMVADLRRRMNRFVLHARSWPPNESTARPPTGSTSVPSTAASSAIASPSKRSIGWCPRCSTAALRDWHHEWGLVCRLHHQCRNRA